jgi:hypothetical protein
MRKLATFDRLTKGQYDSVQPVDVPSGAWARAVNFLPYNRRLNRRGGSDKFSLDSRDATMTTPVVSVIPVSGLANPATSLEEWALCTITRAGEVEFVNPSGSWMGILATGSAALVPEDEMPWRMIVRNSRVYAVRRLGGRMRRIEGGVWRDAGRPPPISAPTLAVSGSGSNLTAGDYKVAYGYYDTATGYYGNPGPSDTITVAAGQQIDVTNLVGKSTAYFADKIVVWVSQPDGETLFEQQQVSAPDAPATTTATITDPPAGDVAPTRNLQPSANATWVEEWGERFWWAVASKMHYSPVGEFESYSEAQALEFEKGSGSDISVIYSWGDKLVVAKRRKIFKLVGFDRTSWETKPWSTKIGCTAPHSMRNCEGRLIFKSEDGFAISEEGEEPQIISSDTVGEELKTLDHAREDLTYAEVWPEQSIYMAVFPKKREATPITREVDRRQSNPGRRRAQPPDIQPESTNAWGGIVYNWKQKAWATVQFPAEPRSLRLGYDLNGNTRLFAVMNDHPQVYTIFEGNTDDGAPIICGLMSGAPRLTEEPGQLASIHSLRILTSGTRWPLTFKIFGDDNRVDAIGEVTTNIEDDTGWKRISIDNMEDPRTQLQVYMEYEGRDPFWIAEWAWDTMPTKKHLTEF